MGLDKFAVLHEEIQKGIADLDAGRVRSGKKVLDDLAFRVAIKQGVAEIQDGKSMPSEVVKKQLKLE